MLKMTTYQYILSTTVTKRLLSRSSYVGAMQKVQESDQDMCHADISPEPVKQRALSECLARSDLLSNQRQRLYNVLQENSGIFRSSIADITSIHSSNTTSILGMLNPSNGERIAPATTIVRKLKNRCKRCCKTALLNPVLVLGPVLLC